MKLSICVLAIFSPVLSWGQLADNWAGVVVDSQGAHRMVLHISGLYTGMKATADIADQKLIHAPVEPITLSGSTLEFTIPASDARYSGVLNDNGAIVGTLTQRGTETPLPLARVVANAGALQVPDGPGGVIENGRYHDALSGVEFDLPSGWFIQRTDPDRANPGGVRIFGGSQQQGDDVYRLDVQNGDRSGQYSKTSVAGSGLQNPTAGGPDPTWRAFGGRELQNTRR